jgi:glycosyltransferase involved in cell wall biosynthesis
LAKCIRCAAVEYGRSKGLAAAVGVRFCAPLLRRKVRAIHSISSYVQTIVRRDFLDDRKAETTATGSIVHDVIGSVQEEDVSAETGSLDRYLIQLPREPFLLFVGALRRVKGVVQLLEAYQRLEQPPPLVLIGTMERDSPPIPPGVIVLRDFPHSAVMAAWERCLFGVLPSVLPEPFGTVVCEAMSRGKAVIGTQPGGHRDMIVPEETGLLVPSGDVDALTRAMERLIQDPDLRDRLGSKARVRARRFTPEVAIPRIERLYVELVAKGER